MPSIEILLMVSAAMFLVGVIDSVAGGGGLISLPVYLMAGLSPRTAFGTNKIMAFTGSCVSTYRYGKEGFVDIKTGIILAVSVVVGELSGTALVYAVPEKYFELFLTAVLPVAALILLVSKRTFSYEKVKNRCEGFKDYAILVLLGFVTGIYSGTVAAASATIGMLLLCLFLHYDVRAANGTVKLAMTCGSFFSMPIYIYNGDVNWFLLVPAVLFNMLGNYVGSGLAVENGAKIIRPAALIMVTAYAIRTIVKMIN